jgi:hypothetical protein
MSRPHAVSDATYFNSSFVYGHGNGSSSSVTTCLSIDDLPDLLPRKNLSRTITLQIVNADLSRVGFDFATTMLGTNGNLESHLRTWRRHRQCQICRYLMLFFVNLSAKQIPNIFKYERRRQINVNFVCSTKIGECSKGGGSFLQSRGKNSNSGRIEDDLSCRESKDRKCKFNHCRLPSSRRVLLEDFPA